MDSSVFNKLEQQVIELVEACKALQHENNELRSKHAILTQEKNHLFEKNRAAAEQIKKVIQRIRTFKT